MLLTVFTTSYNRPAELRRLYESLLKQTCREFVWLIVDDSTDDRVQHLVETLSEEKEITIDYHRQQHRGKHWAQRLGDALVRTPYVVDIDDDDELTGNCVEDLLVEWKKIENEGRDDIGALCGMTLDTKGNVICYHGDWDYMDTDYIEMEWTRKRPSENIISRRSDAMTKAHVFCDDDKWLYNEVSLVRESVLWNRLSKKYRFRYVNKPMRIYHTEGHDRLSVPVFDRQMCVNYVFSNYVMVNELRGHRTENKRDLLKYLAEYMACGIALRLRYGKLIHTMESVGLKTLCVLLTPAAWLVGSYFRKRYVEKTMA